MDFPLSFTWYFAKNSLAKDNGHKYPVISKKQWWQCRWAQVVVKNRTRLSYELCSMLMKPDLWVVLISHNWWFLNQLNFQINMGKRSSQTVYYSRFYLSRCNCHWFLKSNVIHFHLFLWRSYRSRKWLECSRSNGSLVVCRLYHHRCFYVAEVSWMDCRNSKYTYLILSWYHRYAPFLSQNGECTTCKKL